MKLGITLGIAFIIAVGGLLYTKQQAPAEKLTILEIESRFNIELMMPSPLELQQLANRRGADIAEDDIWGKETEKALDKIRCNQEASKYDWMYEVKK